MAFIFEKLRVEEYTYPFADIANILLEEQVKELNDNHHQPSNINAHFTGFNLKSRDTDNLLRWVGDLISRDFIGRPSRIITLDR